MLLVGAVVNPKRLRILAICASYPPEVTPTANRSAKLLARLCATCDVRVLTAVSNPDPTPAGPAISVPASRFRQLLPLLAGLRLSKLIELAVWPDEMRFWVGPAVKRGLTIIREWRPDVLLVFMMPYSAGLVGTRLKARTGLPLVLNFDDSPTCTDMHPYFPSRLHCRLATRLEDFLVRAADRSIFVSQCNLERVQARQPRRFRENFHLIRYGVDPNDLPKTGSPPNPTEMEILYVGGMSGWFAFYDRPEDLTWWRRAYRKLTEFGRVHITRLDQAGSSPIPVGRAVQAVLKAHPEWRGKLRIRLVGNKYPAAVVKRVLENQQLTDLVEVTGDISHDQAVQRLGRAGLLLVALPGRPDGSPGGRISAKVYEYLATDRPIVAAIPPGECEDYLRDRPGVWIVRPDDVAGLGQIIKKVATAHFSGNPLQFDRSAILAELSYDKRAVALEKILQSATGDFKPVAPAIPR
jgi:hypothetical protein